MNIFTFAFKNLKRHKTRTLLTTFGIAIASTTLFSILSFDRGYKKALEEELEGTGIHLFVSTEGCPLEAASLIIRGGEIPRFLNMQTLEQVKKVEGVKVAGGFLIFSIPSPDGSKVDLFYGITRDVLNLKPNWKIKGTWFKDENSIILGSEIARLEKREVGDKIYIESIEKEFTISGILEKTYGQDDGFYFIPIETAQKYFKKENKLTAIGVQLWDLTQIEKVKARLETLPDVYVVPAEQMGREILKLVGGTKALMYSILFIVVMVSILGLLNTLLMATFERQKDFGYLRCIGAGRFDLIKLILLETVTLCLAGGIMGFTLGFILSSGIDNWIRQFLPYVPAGKLLRPNFNILITSAGIVLSLGILAGLYPGYKASKASPMEAIRNE
ncbi:MAG: ABC transporter permease [Candidatus Aenigmatarchaeota archaeon]